MARGRVIWRGRVIIAELNVGDLRYWKSIIKSIGDLRYWKSIIEWLHSLQKGTAESNVVDTNYASSDQFKTAELVGLSQMDGRICLIAKKRKDIEGGRAYY